METDAMGIMGWTGVGLLGVALGIFSWQVVRREEPGWGPGFGFVLSGTLGLMCLTVGLVGLFTDGPTSSELSAKWCAETSGIKVAYITAAQARPDRPLLHVPWDDKERWTFNEVDEIGCGAHIGVAR